MSLLDRVGHDLGPRLRHLLEERVGDLQQRLDRLNCLLAEKAVPGDRLDQVKQLSHGASSGERQNFRVVTSDGKSSAVKAATKNRPATPKAKAAGESAATPKPKRSTAAKSKAETPKTKTPASK